MVGLLVVLSSACSDNETANSSSADGAVTSIEGASDTAQPAGELEGYVSQFVQAGAAASLSLDERCVRGVVNSIPTADDAERSLRNLTGNVESDADNELVLPWIEDELMRCAPVDQIVALMTQYAESQGLSIDANCAAEFIKSAVGFTELESKVVEACGS